jgi:hypothetical protein
MDQLINCLEKISLQPHFDFDNELNDVICQMKSSEISNTNCDIEWEMLSQNYSKLRYLCEIINVFPKKTSTFYKSLDVFFETIDLANQRYLRDIDWYHNEYSINLKCDSVKYFLEQSLNTTDKTMKMKYILNAYSLFIEIGEHFRKDHFVDYIDDQDFLDDFNENVY